MASSDLPLQIIYEDEHCIVYPVANNQSHDSWECSICGSFPRNGRRFSSRSLDVCEGCVTGDPRTAKGILAVIEREIASLARIKTRLEKTISTQGFDPAIGTIRSGNSDPVLFSCLLRALTKERELRQSAEVNTQYAAFVKEQKEPPLWIDRGNAKFKPFLHVCPSISVIYIVLLCRIANLCSLSWWFYTG
jgi:hypothetical protein